MLDEPFVTAPPPHCSILGFRRDKWKMEVTHGEKFKKQKKVQETLLLCQPETVPVLVFPRSPLGIV